MHHDVPLLCFRCLTTSLLYRKAADLDNNNDSHHPVFFRMNFFKIFSKNYRQTQKHMVL
ncbi:hypothetical protein CLOSTASPAR_04238 [[Clostridium] asparagiforme DSM 15981]|uniref:Uncharacterized protein n=1 Tax=[Clostridium] asparagiforme DSM 15981 TaxID=518636 RepID=C0D4P4_9FIRM|nr:hypothetical protein CLOSTASPAR_04238 [[Clostridium] asparagiforme DSM 15981]